MHPSFNKVDKVTLAYAIGFAIGDGNLSNPNGRAIKLRITCDTKYPKLIQRIMATLEEIFPDNKVNTINRPRNCLDIYVHSNELESLVGWKVGKGSKYKQRVRVPSWIKKSKKYAPSCLRGLFETDGSIYNDRGYTMAMFTTIIPELSEDTMNMIELIGFSPHVYRINQKPPQKTRYNIRISKNTQKFIKAINLDKS